MSAFQRRVLINVFASLVLLVAVVRGEENEAWFYRVVSEQPTQIISISRPSTLSSLVYLVWSNAVPSTPARVEARFGLNGTWHTNTTVTRVWQTDGTIVVASANLAWVPGEVIVGFQDSVTNAEATALIEEYGLAVLRFASLGPPAALVKVPVDTELAWCDRLATNSIVRYTEPNYLGSTEASE